MRYAGWQLVLWWSREGRWVVDEYGPREQGREDVKGWQFVITPVTNPLGASSYDGTRRARH